MEINLFQTWLKEPDLNYRKFFLSMKITILLLLTCVMNSIANNSYSQTSKVTLNLKNARVEEVLNEIEKKSDFYFLLNQKKVDINRRVNIVVENTPIKDVLSIIFKNQDINYTVYDRQIILTTKESSILAEMQQKQLKVTGKVTDDSGQPMAGVTVSVSGTTRAVITDANGAYSLPLNANDKVISFSFIGMKKQDVILNGQSVINVSLESETKTLDEVVVVGYGTQKKVNLTGAVSAVKIDEKIASRALTNVSSGLSGLVAGLAVTQSTGMAGGDGASLIIRGLGSPNNSSPLVVVDGMPDVDINRLSMNDIENVSVLKDASSAAIYGSRAANGVILITTKRGQTGKTQLNFTSSSSWRNFTNYYEYMADYPRIMDLHNMSLMNAGKSNSYNNGSIAQWMSMEQIDPIRFPNTNWWDVLFKTGNIQNYTLSASGGTDKMNFYLSGGYMHDNGVSINTDYSRKNFRVNLDYKIRNNIKIGTNIDGVWTDQKYGNPDGVNNQGKSNVQWDIVKIVPGVTVMDPQGRYGGNMAYMESSVSKNMYATIMSMNNLNQQQQFSGNIFGEWEAVKGLTFRVDYGLNFLNEFYKSYTVPFVRWNFQTESPVDVITSNGGITNQYDNSYKTLLQGRATYTKTIFGNHNLTVMAAYNEEYWYGRWLNGSRTDRIQSDLSEINAASNTIPTSNGSSYAEGLRSEIIRVNYNINEKYLFEGNMRADASSKFLSGYQGGIFPSFSVGWRLSQEKFFEPIRKIISSAKIRGSWGLLGNNSGVGRYDQRDTYPLTNYSFGQISANGTSANKMINPDFTWEKTRVSNMGLDLTFFDKITAEIDIYDRLTTDIIRGSELSSLLSSAYVAPNTNIGALQNRGIELNLGWHGKIGTFEYGARLNYAYNKNKLLSWNQRLGYGIPFLNYPYSFTRTYIATGIAQTWQDIADAPYQGNDFYAPGDILYKDVNGDGQITSDDMVALRNSPQSFFNSQYSLSLDSRWKNFDINLIFQASAGSKDFWQDYYNLVYPNSSVYAFNTLHIDNWNLDNRNSSLSRLVIGTGGNNNRQSTYWLYKRDYIRLKNIQIGYNVPKSLLSRVKLSDLRIYFTGENLFTITKWPGIDPEKPGGDGLNSNPYPLIKSFSFGVNVTL